MVVYKRIHNCEIYLKQGDITKEHADVIVNAANQTLLGGGGVDGAIHRAGGPRILEECKRLREKQEREGKFIGCPTGGAVITIAGNLNANFVVHAVGPIWHGGHDMEEEFLYHAYLHSLQLADKFNQKSIIFPAISTGAYGFPMDKAAPMAIQAMLDFSSKESSINEVSFIFNNHDDYEVFNCIFDEMC